MASEIRSFGVPPAHSRRSASMSLSSAVDREHRSERMPARIGVRDAQAGRGGPGMHGERVFAHPDVEYGLQTTPPQQYEGRDGFRLAVAVDKPASAAV